jgi:hypothetical protein
MFNQYIEKLILLRVNTKPLWGKMTPQHMVEHLILAMRMSSGKLKLECFNPPEKLPALKRFLMSSRPLPKLFVNPAIGEKLLPLEYSSLEEAKNILNQEKIDYLNHFELNPEVKTVNVTFGELNKEEWDVFHKKHFLHHFSQFGLL